MHTYIVMQSTVNNEALYVSSKCIDSIDRVSFYHY